MKPLNVKYAEKELTRKHSEAMERIKQRYKDMGEEYVAIYNKNGKNNELW